MKILYDVIILGGGPAGMMAAISASDQGASVALFEKNSKVGKKLFISGKGRCNLTNASSVDNHISNIVHNPRFLRSSYSQFSSDDVIELFNEYDLPLKIERGNRVFPASDKSSDVIKTLERILSIKGVEVYLSSEVTDVYHDGDRYILCVGDDKYSTYSLVVATGGVSYTATGCTGYGYSVAKKFGHSIVRTKSALVPILLQDNVSTLEGLSLKNVKASIVIKDKKLAELFGEMIFTSNGVSGPIILSLASLCNDHDLTDGILSLDLKPAVTKEELTARLIREQTSTLHNRKSMYNYIKTLTLGSLGEYILDVIGVGREVRLGDISKETRDRLIYVLKNLQFRIKSLDDIEYAIVTSGGVDVSGVNPKTMESKLLKGLYFAGEVLDLDAFTGGYNLQIAFSTGYVAGKNAHNYRSV